MTITMILALFVLLLISSATFFVAKRVRLPYTVFLVLIGLLLVPLVNLPAIKPVLGFLENVSLTPELLFYVFLPMLIFESAFNMNVRKLVENAWHISLLSIVSLLVSAFIIAGALYGLFGLIGLPVPFIVTLLFGAIISATDPVAVLALFKEYGAPKRLNLIFEGESLFNDGTAVALFLVVLGVATGGFHGAATIFEGTGSFVMMVVLGIIAGIVMATIFSKALRFTKSNEFVSITVLLVSAHIVFILSELLNDTQLGAVTIHISPIIATTTAALFLGNHARHILSPVSDRYMQKSVEHLAFVANSLVFIMAGILFATTDIDFATLWLPILLTVVIVAAARAISVYAVTWPLNRLRPVSRLPAAWQGLLAWGSLRGALAIIVVLLIPEDYRPAGWEYTYSPREFILALTIGCILATLFIKATTIGVMVNRLGVNQPSAFMRARTLDLGAYYLRTELERIKGQRERGFVHDEDYRLLRKQLRAKIAETEAERAELLSHHGPKLFIQALHLVAISIEQRYLKELYANGEVSETVYRRVHGKLNLQEEKIEYAQHETIDPSSYTDRKDVFERLISFTQTAFDRRPETTLEERYQYYRAQSIIARKVVKTLQQMQTQYRTPIFDDWAYETVHTIYQSYQQKSGEKAEGMYSRHHEALAPFVASLSQRSLHSTGNKALRFFEYKGLADEAMLELVEAQFSVKPAMPADR